MTSSPPTDFYGVLGVAPDAEQPVIESAYRALMKKYHPDVVAAGGGADARRAAEINEAYSVLRDPAKRARYDAEERKRHEASLEPVRYRPIPPERRSTFGGKAFLVVLLLVAAAVYLVSGISAPAPQATAPLPENASQPDPAALAPPAAEAGRDEDQRPPVDRDQVAQAVAQFRRIQETSGASGVTDYSVGCFQRQQRTQRLADFDHCVAFDEAASTWESLGAEPGTLGNSRFAAHSLSVRHINAARLLGEGRGWIEPRLAEIRGLANGALTQTLAGVPLAQPPLAATAVAAPPAVPAARPQRRQTPRSERNQQRRAKAARPKSRPADGDFLEREGYIY